MTPDQWKKIDELLDAALDLPSERHAAYLDEVCEGDEELRRELSSLLAAHEKAGSFIETTPAEGISTVFSERGLDQTQTLVGRTLGHYEIVALIGSGGMGEVYKAHDSRLDRDVAIKVLPQHLSSHPDALSRFEREAKAVAALSHPNILAIHDFGHEGGMAYLVMELLEGESLRQRMAHSILNWRESVKICASVAEGLAAAHAKGIIHRDIKPENVFLTNDGLVKILDFGIARVKKAVVSHAETLISQGLNETKPGTLMGTIGYMSPEQVRGERADAPSDIFSLGCVMLEMLIGERPFARKSNAETMAAILRDDPPLLEAADLPPELDRIIFRCLEKSPEERFQSARDLAFDLRSMLTSSSGTYRAVSGAMPAMKIAPTDAKHPAWLLPAIAAAVLLAVAVIAWATLRQPTTPTNTVAILPFENSDKDQAINYLCEGIPESITISLAEVPQIRVMGWSTVKYKTQAQKEADPQKIGRDLKVYAVVVGKIAKTDSHLTVTVEMINVSDGRQLWGNRFEIGLDEARKVQSEIAGNVSENLQVKLSGEQQRQLSARYNTDAETYQAYLKGRYYLNERASNWEENLKKAIEHFQKATESDPRFALAYAGLADAYVLLEEDSANTLAAANRALKLNPQLVEPKAAIAFARAQFDWQWQESEKGFLEAIREKPRYATAHHWYAEFLATQGRFDESLKEIKLAAEIEPLSMPISVDWGLYLFFARQFDEAIAQFQKTLRFDPNNTNALTFMSAAYEAKGDYQQAVNAYLEFLRIRNRKPEEIETVKTTFGQQGVTAYWRLKLGRLQPLVESGDSSSMIRAAYLHSSLGETDNAINLLEEAYKKRFYALWYLKVDPRYDKLRDDPRFADLLKRVGF
ncbi:MAG: protein kinase [Acidobacteriota bacterium]|nr:protein kinase [Acidobacteriota bacterium]